MITCQPASPFRRQERRGGAMLSPRSGRKPGLQSFTDPMNPFARTMSKAMTNLQEARADPQRAGARTKNPGMIPVTEGGDRLRFSVYRYGGVEYKPQKRCPDISGCPTPAPSPRSQVAPSPRSSPGATEALRMDNKCTTALENYLNDMKRCRTSLRVVPAMPSAQLQRKNHENLFVPFRRSSFDGSDAPQAQRRSRSLSVEPNLYEEGRACDPYGFSRKRLVSGASNYSNRELLYHLATERPEAPTPTPRASSVQENKPEMSRCLSAYKARNIDSTGLLYSASPVTV